MAVMNYISQIFTPVESLGMEIQTIQSAIAGIHRINEFFTLEEKKELTLPGGDRRTILYIRKTAPCPKTYPRKVGIAEKKPVLGE